MAAELSSAAGPSSTAGPPLTPEASQTAGPSSTPAASKAAAPSSTATPSQTAGASPTAETPATTEPPRARATFVPATPREASAAQGGAFGGGGFRAHHKSGTHEPGGHAHRRLQASRLSGLVAGGAVLALIPGLMIAAPANAAETISPQQLQATIASNSKLIAQKLQVSSAVSDGSVQRENYVAGAIAGIVAAESGPNGPEVAVALAQALQFGGEREKIVESALTYLGDPYVLGGASHDGIDCSGLTMVAYATVGVSLVHYVPSQDAVATTISEATAQSGDLVFFNDDEHVALYLGGGMIIEAPDYGIPVRIVSLSTWSGIGYHFGRILNS
ncbi:C40 family peptidase [Humibacter antri]